MGFTLDIVEEQIWYEPDHADNRILPDDERLAFLIQPASATDFRRMQERAASRMSKRPDRSALASVHAMQMQVLAKCVLDVRNLNVRRGGVVEVVSDVGQALGLIPDSMITDLYNAIEDHSKLSEGQAKN